MPVVSATGNITREPSQAGQSATAVFTVSLDQASTVPITLKAYTQNGTASDADYSDFETTVTIPAGATTATIPVTIRGQVGTEGTETYWVILTSLANATFVGGASALQVSGTILPPGSTAATGVGPAASPIFGPTSVGVLPTIRVYNVHADEEAGVGGATTSIRFLVVLDKASATPISVDYVTYDMSGVSGSDYQSASGTLVIPAGQLSAFVTVTGLDDTLQEWSDGSNFQVLFTNPKNAAFEEGGVALLPWGLINDNENGPPPWGGIGARGQIIPGAESASSTLPTLTALNFAAHEPNQLASNTLGFLVTLNRPAANPVTVHFSTEDGLATAGRDFVYTSGSLTFSPGQQTAFIPVTILGDGVPELTETFNLILTGVTGAVFAQGASALVASGILIDAETKSDLRSAGFDSMATPIIGPTDGAGATPVVRVVSTSVNEGSGRAGIYLLFSHATTSPVTVHVNTLGMTASVGDDFTPLNQDYTIPTGTLSDFISVSIVPDTRVESDEWFTANFTNLVGAKFEGGGTSATATILIRDDDGGGTAGGLGGITPTGPQFATASAMSSAVYSVLRTQNVPGISIGLANAISGPLLVNNNDINSALHQIIVDAKSTTSVATMSYQFFTGVTPSSLGIDYLVSPTGPNANNLNSAYYQSFSLENRYINFAVNLGKVGAGQLLFQAGYGSLSLSDALSKAYTTIFGSTPTASKVDSLLNAMVSDGHGGMETRAQYFAFYGQDGLGGIGTKAAMVGWLLAEAVKAEVGDYALSNETFLTNIAYGSVDYGVDFVGRYYNPDYHYIGG